VSVLKFLRVCLINRLMAHFNLIFFEWFADKAVGYNCRKLDTEGTIFFCGQTNRGKIQYMVYSLRSPVIEMCRKEWQLCPAACFRRNQF
jgi:hypothetical protein